MKEVFKLKKSYCMNCKKEVSNDTKKCECGGTYFVYGENFKFTGKNIVCNCGSDKFKKGTHIDFTYKAVTNHICSNCGNQIQTESFRRWIIS